MATKETPLSETATKVLEFVRENPETTMADIKKEIPNANPAHLNALRNRGLVSAEKIEKEVLVTTKRKVLSYSPVETETSE